MMTTGEATPLAIEDYEAIEAAVMETARGRWFLSEYARRHRQADTLTIVSTLERIERTMKRQRKTPDIDRIRLDLADMAEAISRTKQEIFQMKVESEEGGRFAEASHELDAIVNQTEQATDTILSNAEKVQELAWTLRENGAGHDVCDALDAHITEIYTGCSFQDLTGQRTRKVVTVLRYLESRINTMTGIWGMEDDGDEAEDREPQSTDDGLEALAKAATSKPEVMDSLHLPSNPFDTRPDAHLLNGPQLDGEGIDQADIDSLMDFSGSADDFVAVHAEDTGLKEADRTHNTQGPATDAADASANALDETPADVFAAEPAKPAIAPAEPRPVMRTVSHGNTALAMQPALEIDAEQEAAPALLVVKSADPIAELNAAEKLIVFG